MSENSKMSNYSESFKRDIVSFCRYSQDTMEDIAQKTGLDIQTLQEWTEEFATKELACSEQEKQTLQTLFFDHSETISMQSTLSNTSVETVGGTFFGTWFLEELDSTKDAVASVESNLPNLDSKNPISARGKILGEGGMGVVFLGTQTCIGREVAVKEVRPDKSHPKIIRSLLQEAWITGILEHPNIIPIYSIDKNNHDQPMIVMKRIEGKTWSSYIHDPSLIVDVMKTQDILGWHLDIFLQVCSAMQYAHNKGFLHRDLKPENIMIGSYGEIYVLDWGIAVALDDRYNSWIPTAKNIRTLAGTPSYMAPEMTQRDGGLLCEQSDIYLLGAILYEIVNKVPPHKNVRIDHLEEDICCFVPEFLEQIPQKLQDIICRALENNPKDRHSSVEELRYEIQAFLEFRQVENILDAFFEKLQLLKKYLQQNRERNMIYMQYLGARFGKEQLDKYDVSWSDYIHSFQEATILVIEWELSHERLEAAELLLEELSEVDPKLMQQMEHLRERKKQAQQKLRHYEVTTSETIGIRTRAFIILLTVLGWLAFPVWHLIWQVEYTYAHLHIQTAGIWVWILAIGYWARNTLSTTDINRRVYSIFLGEPLMHLVSDLCAWSIDWSAQEAWMLRFVVWNTMMLCYALIDDIKFLPLALGYSVMTIAVFQSPEYMDWMAISINGFLLFALVLIWRNTFKMAEDARELDKKEFL